MKLFYCPSLILIIFGLNSCSTDSNKDENDSSIVEIYPKNAEMKYSEYLTFQMKKGSSTLNSSNYTWSTSNDKIGTISPSGIVSPKLIGSLVISSKDKNTNEVFTSQLIINPTTSLFNEPVKMFGKPKQDIKNNEYRVLISETVDSDNHDVLIYKGENNDVETIRYTFYHSIPNSKSLGLSSIDVNFRKDSQLENKISNFYKERYIRDNSIITDWHGYDLNKTVKVGVRLNSVVSPNRYDALYSKY